MRGVPAITRLLEGLPVLAWEHRFRFTLPREYPHRLALQVVALTPLYHPRISTETGKTCYFVHGELDRVLLDLVANVLLRPDVVRPPSEYPGADWGVNRRRMEWYIDAGPARLHEYLLSEWRGKRAPLLSLPRGRDRDPLRILE